MKKLLLYLFAIMAFVACTDSSDNENHNNSKPNAPEITLDTAAANFTTEGGSTIVTFTSSDAWTAEIINSRADEWCSISPASGSAGNARVTITTTVNDTTDDRTATVIIKSGTTQKTIAVSQKQKDALTVTSSKFEISADGGEVEIEVNANIDFNIEIEETAKSWITHRSTRAMKTSTLIMEVAENDDAEKRKANITITSGNLMETITIYQDGFNPSIVLTQNEFTIPSTGETIAVEVKSNVDVTIEMPKDVDWISENTTRATSTNTYYFDIATNDEYDARKAEIKFINKDNNLGETVTINQSQKDAIVIANDSYEVNGVGGEIEIEVSYNIEFDITIDGEWITQKQTRTLETSKLIFVVTENTTDKVREGSITFTSKDGDISQKISVTQSIPKYEITYTTNDGKIATPMRTDVFGASIVSNVYKNGIGVITFDGTITSIGDYAFFDCSNLTSITIPDSVTLIGERALYRCSSLTSVTISDNVALIGVGAFSGCSSLTSITIPDSVTLIGDGAFENCSSLTSFYGKFASEDNRCLIIDGVLKSFAQAGLTTYAIPNSATAIGENAFKNCKSLTSVAIPDSVTSIRPYAFNLCSGLTYVTISNNVSSIGVRAFEDCNSLITLTIPDSVTSIGDNAFSGCKSLTSVNIGNSVTTIGASAFYGCNKLTSVTIPDSVTSIGNGAFSFCSSLANITIGNSVTTIGANAFESCVISSVTIPDSVTSIGSQAFTGCVRLENITIGNSVTSIGGAAFYSCNSLTSVTIPDCVTSIGENAFRYCECLTSVTIGNSVTSIGTAAFEHCSNLKSVYCKPTIPPILGTNNYMIGGEVVVVFDYNATGRKIYVPKTSLTAYKDNTYWKEYAGAIFVDPSTED